MIKNEMTQYAVEEANTSWGKLRLIWIIVFVAGLVFVGRDAATARDEMIGLGQIHRIVCIFALAIILLHFFLKNPSIPFKSTFFFLTLFSFWQIITSFWSTFPAWTLYRSVEYLIIVWITAYCAASLRDVSLFVKWIDFVWICVGLLVFTVWLSLIIAPDIARGPSKGILSFSLMGAYPRINSNSVSMFGGILGIISFVRMRSSSENKWKFLFLISIATMILSQGRSGMGAFALGILVAIMLMRQVRFLLMLFILASIMITFYAFDELFWDYLLRGQTEAQFWLFSGRINVWDYTYHKFIIDQPLAGFGAYAAGRFLALEDYLGWSSLHSTWIESFIGNGIPATIFFALIVIYAWIILVKYCLVNYGNEHNSYFIEIASVFTALIFRSVFTTQFMMHNDFVFFLIMGTVFYIKHNTFNANNLN